MSDGEQEMPGGAEGGLPNQPMPKQEAKTQPKSTSQEYLIPGPEAEHGGF